MGIGIPELCAVRACGRGVYSLIAVVVCVVRGLAVPLVFSLCSVMAHLLHTCAYTFSIFYQNYV